MSTPSRRKTRPATRAAEPSRSELRDGAARAALLPLAPGERPAPLLVAIAAAAALGLGNLIAYAVGATIGGEHPGPGVLAFTGLMGLMAGGMWTTRYWAVLIFEALLTLIMLAFSLLLVAAVSLAAAAECAAVIGACGWLFWKLIRVMGRLAVTRIER
ncbi:MAG: hypothetical protein ABSG64_09990 [Solirubrobacteraceae bacterium]